MKNIFSIFTLVSLLSLSALVVEAQTVVISGPASAMLNDTKTYSVSLYDVNGQPVAPVGSVQWSATGGQVISSQNTQAQVQWINYGTDYVEFTYETFDDFYYGIFYVAVVVPDPNTTFGITYNCNNTVVTRNSGPPSGVDWYWQTSSDGT